jgi:hypothetical protein
MKSFWAAAAAAVMLAACGEKEDNSKQRVEVEVDARWQTQDTSKTPLIKSVTRSFPKWTSADGRMEIPESRYVRMYTYDGRKIASEEARLEKYFNFTGRWQWTAISEISKVYNYYGDSVVCVEKPIMYAEMIYYTHYYYLNEKGLATRYKRVPDEQYAEFCSEHPCQFPPDSINDFYFEYDSTGKNISMFRWDNKNIAGTTSIGEHLVTAIANAQYDTGHANNYFFVDNKIFLGRSSENLVSNTTNSVCTYLYDSRGRVIQMNEQYANDSIVYTSYEYY